ncbi:ankyrin and armadillo repeat-containing protein [Heterocephalus glaber]|uniref:Ankyrin and armadillo repeat-containing protein n=1 Tax=Heterocephalus glaber TaxID=10181 RepID=A0AAX6SA68_HETGA|nr:ankyrin and armadillo repeat-containing protein [Heterocephalus glaber]
MVNNFNGDFFNPLEDVLQAVSSAAIAEVARGNREVQDAIAQEGAIPHLVALFKGKHLSVQMKGAVAVESLASYNPPIQKAFLENTLTKYLLKLLKAFQIDIKEQGAAALWALAGQTLKQQKYMAEQIGYNFIINMLLSPSAKMQYVGGEAVIALSKDSRMHQNQICEGNGIAPLVRLLRINKIAEGTLLSVIRAVGSICIGIAHTSNPISQQFIVDENAFPVLIQLLRDHPSPTIKVEAAFFLACIVLGNDELQKELQDNEGFKYSDILYLLHSTDKVCTACSCALGYLTYNANGFLILLKECRNKPNQFLRIRNNISRDASINPAFLKEFQMQQMIGLPSLRCS